jgi:D-alanine-D-alanine ligase
MSDPNISVVVLYNQVGEDEYEKLKAIDPKTLSFKPEYDIHVATVSEEYEAVIKALRSEGFKVRGVNLRDDLHKFENSLRRNPPDVVFNLVEHFKDDPELEASIAGLLDLHGVPYTGSPPFALSLCQRKGLAKQILLANGVPTPRFRLLTEPRIPKRHGLHYPLIVKPAREDASAGVGKESVVTDHVQLMNRLEYIFHEFSPPILVEEFIEGKELHVSVWDNDPPEVLPPIEFDFSDLPPDYPQIISYEAKWDPLVEVYHQVFTVCPAPLSKRALKRVEEVSVRAYELTGCRDYARLDIRLAKYNRPYVLEVNPNPDLTEAVSFMESAEKAGYSFSEALAEIVQMALSRKPEPTTGEVSDPEQPVSATEETPS